MVVVDDGEAGLLDQAKGRGHIGDIRLRKRATGLIGVLHQAGSLLQKSLEIPAGGYVKAGLFQSGPGGKQHMEIIAQGNDKSPPVPHAAVHHRLIVGLPVEAVRLKEGFHIRQESLAHQLLHVHIEIVDDEDVRALPCHDLDGQAIIGLLLRDVAAVAVLRQRPDQFYLHIGVHLLVDIQRRLDQIDMPALPDAEDRQALVGLRNCCRFLPDRCLSTGGQGNGQ